MPDWNHQKSSNTYVTLNSGYGYITQTLTTTIVYLPAPVAPAALPPRVPAAAPPTVLAPRDGHPYRSCAMVVAEPRTVKRPNLVWRMLLAIVYWVFPRPMTPEERAKYRRVC